MQVYSEPQERAAALPGFRQESVASPALLGAAGDAQIALGSGLMAAGTGLDAIAVHMQTKENLQKVQDASAAYSDSLQKWQEQAQKTRTNAAAAGVVTDFSEWHKKEIEAIGKTLGNDAQRIAFTNVARKTGLAARHDLATFEIQQTRSANKMADDAMFQSNTNAGAVALTQEAADVYKTNIINGTRAYDAANNLDPEITKARLEIRLTEFHAQRIQNLARTDPMGAKAYFEANKNEIAGQKQAEIGKFADAATAEATATAAGGMIFATVGPEKGLDVMEEAARTKFKNDPITLKATIANLRERTQAFDKGQQERTEAVGATVNNAVLNGATAAQVRRMPEFIALSTMGAAGSRQANQIIEHVENRAYNATLRATASEARQQQVLARRGFAAYLDYSNPDKLAGMSENQITNLLPTLGNELTGHLMQQKRSLVKKEDKLIEARMDRQDFETTAQSVGLRPFDPHKTEEEKASLGNLQYQVENQINAWQISNKKEMPRQDKINLMRRMLDNKVLVDEWGTDPTKSVYMLKPGVLNPRTGVVEGGEDQKAYVNVGGKDIYLATIPAADRTAIISARQRAGLPVTEQSIAEMWVKKKKGPGDGIR